MKVYLSVVGKGQASPGGVVVVEGDEVSWLLEQSKLSRHGCSWDPPMAKLWSSNTPPLAFLAARLKRQLLHASVVFIPGVDDFLGRDGAVGDGNPDNVMRTVPIEHKTQPPQGKRRSSQTNIHSRRASDRVTSALNRFPKIC